MNDTNQDIGALLAEVNSELIAQKNNHDDYELNFESDDNNDDDNNDDINKNNENLNKVDNNNNKNNDNKVIDTSKILKDAAQKIQQEEKVLLDKVITNVSNEIKMIPHPPLSKKSVISDNDNNDNKSMNAMNILIEASRDVDQNIKTNNKDKDHLSIKMIDDDIDNKIMNITDDDDDDDDDDDQEEEEDNNDYDTSNDATRLNQTLLFACYNDKIENVKLLLNKNVNYFIRDRHGWTPLHWACSKGYEDIVNILITHVIKLKRNLKVYINTQDKITGWTALHVRNNE